MLQLLYHIIHTAGAIPVEGVYTESSLPMHIIDLNCTGTEQRLIDCPHNSLIGVHVCGVREDASLRCQGQQTNEFLHYSEKTVAKYYILITFRMIVSE